MRKGDEAGKDNMMMMMMMMMMMIKISTPTTPTPTTLGGQVVERVQCLIYGFDDDGGVMLGSLTC